MTREEAIDVLKKTIAYESDFAEAKRMAIESLSAEPSEMSVNVEYDIEYLPDKDGIHQAIATITKIEPIGDLISRHDAIEAVCKAVCEDDVSIFPECDQIKYCNEIQALLALPSADRPQGEDWDKYSEELWRLAYKRGQNDRPQGETEPAPVVAYICDRRRCAICRGPDGGCDHTTDIKHAAHFKNVAGQYFERPYMEEEDDE